MRKFLTKTAIYVFVVVAIALALNMWYLQINPNHTAMNVPENIQVCNFGSSHGCAFNYADFKGKHVCSNFSMTSQSLFYDYSILQHYQDKIRPGATVFILASYFSFFGTPEAESKTFQAKNKRYYKFLPRELIMQYDRNVDLFIKDLPCLSPTGLTVFIKHLFKLDRTAHLIPSDFNRRDTSEIKTTNPSDAAITASQAYGRHISGQFDENGRRLRRQESFEAIYGMIDLCKKLGAKPILVTVPYLREYTDAFRKNDPEFFSDFYAVIEEIKRNTGIEYYDYAFDERFCRDYSLFANADHMNIEGARRFTNTLLHEVLGIDTD